MARMNERRETIETEKLALLKNAWKDLIQPKLLGYLEGLEAKSQRAEAETRERYGIEARIGNLKAIVDNSSCPTCEQDIAPKKREQIATELGSLEAELLRVKNDFADRAFIIEKQARLSRIKQTLATTKIPAIDKELREISLRATEIDNEMEELETQLKSHDTADIARKRGMRDGYMRNLGKIENDIKDRRAKLDENDRQQESLTRHIELNADARQQKSSKLVLAYTQLRDVFSDSINALRDNLRTSVEALATEAFAQLTTEPTYKGLRINENYGLTIIDREGRDVAQRSAGAEQIVALSLIDGLNRTARKTGPIIMDTPLGRLDLKHRQRVLEYLPKMADQVILLVHEGEIRKGDIIDSLQSRIGGVYNIERVSSSESKLSREVA
jgi:DNA sulfur modification protein DndD